MKNPCKRFFLDALVIGAALFSMFFGAGNMIFPPFLGLQSGATWFLGFVSYFFADIGLAMLAIFALIRKHGPTGIVYPLGRVAGDVLLAVIALCLGLIIAVPRTAATTYELSIQPLLGDLNLPVFCVIFFSIVLLLSLSESKVVDIVGKVLTPLLFFGLLILICKGVFLLAGTELVPKDTTAVVRSGISAGYQTMDVFAAIFLGVLALDSATKKGYTSSTAQAKVTTVASLVASIGLLAVYLGLTYLGASSSSFFSVETNRTALLTSLIQLLFPGKSGIVFFGIVVGLACLTTAIALTSSTASYFTSLLNGRVPYRLIIVIICTGSAVIACIGVEQIIAVAANILAVVYPPVLVLVILSFFDKWLSKLSYQVSAYAALAVSLLDTVGIGNQLISSLPLPHLTLHGFSPRLSDAWSASSALQIGKTSLRVEFIKAQKQLIILFLREMRQLLCQRLAKFMRGPDTCVKQVSGPLYLCDSANKSSKGIIFSPKIFKPAKTLPL